MARVVSAGLTLVKDTWHTGHLYQCASTKGLPRRASRGEFGPSETVEFHAAARVPVPLSGRQLRQKTCAQGRVAASSSSLRRGNSVDAAVRSDFGSKFLAQPSDVREDKTPPTLRVARGRRGSSARNASARARCCCRRAMCRAGAAPPPTGVETKVSRRLPFEPERCVSTVFPRRAPRADQEKAPRLILWRTELSG